MKGKKEKERKKTYNMKGKQEKEKKKHTTVGIRWWSPTQLLIYRSEAYVWQSGRDLRALWSSPSPTSPPPIAPPRPPPPRPPMAPPGARAPPPLAPAARRFADVDV